MRFYLSGLVSPRVLSVLRFLLGLMFLYASLGKILDPKSFAGDLVAYQLFPSPQIIKYVAVTLPWVEWFCGTFLVLGVFVRSVSALSSCLLIAFLVGMLSALARGLEIHCGCFGSSQETIGVAVLLRDGFFLACSLVVFVSEPDPFSLQSFYRNLKSAKTSSPK